MEHLQKRRIIKTTLGDLIAVLTEEAFLVAEDKDEVNTLVADMVGDLLSRAGRWH
jgi:hypothetical protein